MSKKKLVSQFYLMDDDFFSVVMANKAACEVVIRTLTEIEDLKVIEVKTQLSELLQYFKKSDPDNDKFGKLSKAIK